MTKDLDQTRVEWINLINEQNEIIKNNLKLYRGVLANTNWVVVSKDFIYCVADDGTGMLDVNVMGAKDEAQRFNINTAVRIAESFKAENGNGKIEWDVMPVREYLNKLLEQNNRTIALISNKD